MADRLTTDAIVAELAATIDAYNDAQARRDEAQEKVEYERKEGLAELLNRLPCDRPEHYAFRASWAMDRVGEIADRSLSRVEARDIAAIERVIEGSLQALIAVAPPPKGTPWRTVVEFFVGCLPEPEPDPLVDLEARTRRLGKEYEVLSETAEPERCRQAEDELFAVVDALYAAEAKTLAGAAAQLRRLLFEMEGRFGMRSDGGCEKVLRGAIALMDGRA